MIHTYNVTTQITSAKVDLERLQDEINNSSITPSMVLLKLEENIITIEFDSILSASEITSLDALLLSHSGEPYPEESLPQEVKVVEEISAPPFAAKTLSTGQKLFKRIHGTFQTIPANSTANIELIVPYNQAKINALEILGASHGDTSNFNVYDNAAGTVTSTLAATGYTAIPNFKLNQFGYNVCMRAGFHMEESQYDADVILGMKLQLEYTNNTNEEVVIGANFILHELV